MRSVLFSGSSLAFVTLATLAAAQAAPAPAPAPAPGETAPSVSEVVVTAGKRTERLIDVPAAVTAIQGQTLQNIGAQNVADFAALVPGLTFAKVGAGNQLVLRGIAISGAEPSSLVGVVVDGVPVGSSTNYAQGGTQALDSALWDVDRVEVLRGPQGTLYGANAMGGLLSYVYNQPSLTTYGGALEAEGSSTEHGSGGWAARGMANLPIVEGKVGLRISGYHEDDGGYIGNSTLGLKDVDRDINDGARADLLMKPTDHLSVDLEGFTQHNHRGASDAATYDQVSGQPIVGPLTNTSGVLDPATFDYKAVALTVDYDFGPVRLTSISSWERLTDDTTLFYSDTGAGEVLQHPGLVGLTTPAASAVDATLDTSLDKYNQELRLTSTWNSPFQYIAGLFYTHESALNYQDINGFGPGLAPIGVYTPALEVLLPSTFQEYAVFGEASYTLFQRLKLTAGIRYSHDETTFSDTNTGLLDFLVPDVPLQSGSADTETYLFTANYALTADSSLYARVASGYRPGGPNVHIVGAPEAPIFAPDTLWNYEAGYKASFLGGLATFDIDAFYIKWRNIQAETSFDGFSEIANGGEASSRGVEAEGALHPVHGLSLGGNIAYTDAHLDQTSAVIGGAAGDQLPYSAKWSGALYGDWTFPLATRLSGFVGGTLRAVGQRHNDFPNGYTVGDPDFILPSYVMGDLRAGLEYDRYRLTAFVDNVGDAKAEISAVTLYGVTNRTAQVIMARPRTVGLRLDARF